jgi:hypothetical protein
MFITKKHLPRRTVLRGMGAAMALPLLDAMIPAATALANTAANPVPRLGFIYVPHGAVMAQWTPQTTGADFNLPPILEALNPYQKYLTVLSNIGNRPAESSSVHAIVPATWLSCTHPHSSPDPFCAPTADQIAAQAIGQDTPLPSIEVATEKGGVDAACDRTYGCVYSSTISFRTATTPLPMEYNPRKLFQKLFGRGDSPQQRGELAAKYASALDLVMADAADLQRNLDAADRAVLADYLDSVREIERRVHQASQQDLTHVRLPDVPVGIPENFEDHLNLMFDMIQLAYQTRLTNVATFMMACEVSSMTYRQIGVPDAFHPLSHHQNDPAKMERLAKIQAYHTKILARFLGRMAATPDGEGSLLDHSILLYGSNMSDSNIHNNYPLPTAVIGGGCGTLRGNRHLVMPPHTPLSNLLLTLLHKAGVKIDRIGDSTGIMSEV